MNEELINVLVPRSRLLEVYSLLGKSPQAVAEAAKVSALPATEWSDALVARAYRESSPKMKVLLSHLAERPGVRVTSGELAKAVDYTPHQFAGLLGAAGRRFKNRYAMAEWFFGAEWSGEAWSWVYWMAPEVAELIKAEQG